MNNIDPFSPEKDRRTPMSTPRSSTERVVIDTFTEALLAGETKIREERARAYAGLGNVSCRDCPLFNNRIDPFAWARNAQNLPAHIVREYTAQYLKRLEAARQGKCSGLVRHTEELVIERVSVVVEQEEDPSLRGQSLGEVVVERCGLDVQGPRPMLSN